MSSFKHKASWGWGVVIAAAVALAGCGDKPEANSNNATKQVVLGYVPASLAYPFNVATARGFEERAGELGAKAIVLDPRGSLERQANAIDDLVEQGAQGIAVLPLDAIVAQSWVDAVTDRGIPFVSVNSQIGDPQKVAWTDVYPKVTAITGMDNEAAGALSDEIAAGLLPRDREVKIGIIEGAPGYIQVIQRSTGFKRALTRAGVNYRVVAEQPTDWTPEKGETVCQNILTSHPDVDLLFSQADDMAIGCARAIQAANANVPLVSTAGGARLGIEAVQSGDLYATVCDKPFENGRLAAQALYDALTQANPKRAQLLQPHAPAITRDNLSDCPELW